jgi:hypothetical protein
MDAQKVDMYLISHAKFFQSSQIPYIRERLLQLDESRWPYLHSLALKDPTTSIIISVLIGSLGIDRFMIGDTGLGIGKLLTCGGFGIWTIIDWFLIMDATRDKNMAMLQNVIQ